MSTDEATIKLTEIIKQQTDELNQKIEKMQRFKMVF